MPESALDTFSLSKSYSVLQPSCHLALAFCFAVVFDPLNLALTDADGLTNEFGERDFLSTANALIVEPT